MVCSPDGFRHAVLPTVAGCPLLSLRWRALLIPHHFMTSPLTDARMAHLASKPANALLQVVQTQTYGRRFPSLLQTKPAEPAPATRLALLLNMISLVTLLTFHAGPVLLVRCFRLHSAAHRGPGLNSATCTTAAAVADNGSYLSAGDELRQEDCEHGVVAVQEAATAADAAQQSGHALLCRQPSAWRPAAPLQRGLSARFEGLAQQRPRLHRALALAGLVVFSVGVATGQVVAPGFVDPSIGEFGLQAQSWVGGQGAGLC